MKKNKGFTIIELLVATAIIATLVGVAAVNFERSKAKSRDARRIADVATLKAAMLMYNQENGSFSMGPGCNCGYQGMGFGTVSDKTSTNPNYGSESIVGYLYAQKFIDKIVNDPNGYVYDFHRIDGGCNATASLSHSMAITARMEILTDATSSPCDSTTGGCNGNVCLVDNVNYMAKISE